MNLRAYLADPRHRRVVIGLAAGAAVLVLLVLRRRKPATATSSSTTDPTFGTGDVGPLVDPSSLTNGVPSDLTGGVSGTGSATDTGGVSPVTDATAPGITLDPGQSYVDPSGHLVTAPFGPSDSGDGGTGSSSGGSSSGGGSTGTGGTGAGGGSGGTSGAAAPKTSAGFWWTIGGKQTWITSKNRGVFEAEVRKHGGNLMAWAANHPDAARAIGITPPAAPPPQKPAASSPARETGGAARSAPSSSVARPSGASLGGVPVSTIIAGTVTTVRPAVKAPSAPVRRRVGSVDT